ncbi:MAG: ABC transporter ATP-binding protein [Deltaproteobacteria bacterium]|nr:ABC transporter ATP-binding protein [Deltaproteobacteria bacterium]
MIALSDIFYRYPGAADGWTLEGINLSILKGEFVLICGSSGSGKSTLAYLFNGLVPHFFGGYLRGSVTVDGLDTKQTSVAGLLPKVGLVLQNTDAHLFCSTVEDEIAFGLESVGLPAAEIPGRVRWIAETLSIHALLSRSPQALSGGERRLVAIASVLCLDPPLLVLDEPFAHLDWQGMGQVRDLLIRLHQRGKTLAVIEQRVRALLPHASRCVIMEQGKIVFDGAPRRSIAVLQGRHLLPVYPKKAKEASKDAKTVLTVRNLSCEQDGRRILQDLSLEVKEGEAVALVGRNGSGKTTLIRHFNGLRRPKKGSVFLMGSPVKGKSPLQLASLVGISFQNPNDQFFKNTVTEELTAGLKALRKGERTLHEICDLFDLQELMDRSPYRLSEGQKRRVALASVVAMDPRILVIDEPTVGQDGQFLEAIAGLIGSLRDRGHTVVVVTHDLEFAHAVADRWIVMQGGKKVGDGRAEEIMADEELMRAGAVGAKSGWGLMENEIHAALS